MGELDKADKGKEQVQQPGHQESAKEHMVKVVAGKFVMRTFVNLTHYKSKIKNENGRGYFSVGSCRQSLFKSFERYQYQSHKSSCQN